MNMNKQSGFTLIELVMVVVIIGILASMAVPRFYDASSDALLAAQKGTVGAVRAAHVIAIAENKRNPTVAELAARIGTTPAATDATTGVKLKINGVDYIVDTFSDSTCGSATAAGEQVGCVGGIALAP